ncbi:tryptophan 7-halogenase [Oleiagrimonas sp.]|jgi:flavin-dependent dehydrogenase|uniref:NAD(P)/FAD-dependent oxidoreductase n=1 Tax=Oleiagrimonas sp. TaxID=2010330 RepID=UPI0026328C25|nr:tryptophan 7-halogenase [Oleiagrimonas sp.]MDA3913842.1 tryptophan 7-halogenase [Oleiagrimonas sp.]
MTRTTMHDAVILGGGLAGLTLALHLRGEFPELDIVVLERRRHPLPAAAHKVGESTVEIGAHYFAETLGLREHLERDHIRKFGFRFFFSDGRDDLENVTELGASQVLPTPSYQLDRGILENFLNDEARRRGIDVRDGTTISGLGMGEDGARHTVRCRDETSEYQLHARWLLDASGRAGMLRRHFQLTRDNDHHGNAVWFRLDDRIEIDGWCEDSNWRGRCTPPERWRSTNHLVGPGYWAWLIPLSSGAHSVGIVADAGMHPLESMRDFERTLEWLGTRQPALARAVAARRDALLDFSFLRDYSHGCAQMFSANRWALTGEAGAFLDPFYSPGSDFIAIENTYIVALVGHDLAGRNLAPYTLMYEQLLQSFLANSLPLFRNQYPLFGDAEVLPVKVTWDYTYYWGVLCPLVFQKRLTDLTMLAAVRDDLERAQALNLRMQALFLDWHASSANRNPRAMLDQYELAWFAELNRGLHDPLDDAALVARLREHVDLLEALADTISLRATQCDARLRAPLSGRRPPPLYTEAA